jgi:hypothetical protein
MRSAIQAAANPNQGMCAVHVVVSCTTSMIARLLKQLAHEEGEEATERKDSPQKRYNVSVYPSCSNDLADASLCSGRMLVLFVES